MILHFFETAFYLVVSYVLVVAAHAISIRLRPHLPRNAFVRFLYKPHRMRPPYQPNEIADWIAWAVPLGIFAVMLGLLIWSDPNRH